MEIGVDGEIRSSTKSKHELMQEHDQCAYSSPRTFQHSSIYMLETHVNRLFTSYERNGKAGPVATEEIRALIIDHTKKYLAKIKHDIVVYVFLNYENKNFTSFCLPIAQPSDNPNATLVQLERTNPHIKDLAWVKIRDEYEQKLTKENVEFIIYNSQDIVTECLFSNVFIVDTSGTIITAPEDMVLQGTMRSGVIKTCQTHDIPFKEATFTKDMVLSDSTSEVFITNSLVEVLPLASVNGIVKKREIGRKISSLIQNIIIEYCTRIIE